MLYNKNNVRKTNDKKILHKVGKQWKVISVALLMAIGGGAVATHAANAQSNNGVNASTSAEVAALEQKPAVQSAQSVAPSSAASSSASAKPSSAVSYQNGANGSAAMYHAKAVSDKAAMASNGAIVSGYVKSLNNKFSNVTTLANSSVASANATTKNDAKLASSYAAIANDKANSSVVSALASKAGYTAGDYANYVVKPQASNYNRAVSDASAYAKAVNLVSGLAQEALLNKGSLSDMANQAANNAMNASVNARIAGIQNGFNAKASDGVSKSLAATNTALQSATVESALTSGQNRVDMAEANALNSGSASSVVASYANNNSAAVNSAVNSYATAKSYSAFNAPASYALSGVNSLTNAINSSAYSDMNDLVSNAYALNSDASLTAHDNSVIASANAAKASLSNASASYTAASNNAKNALTSVNAASDAAKYADEALSTASKKNSANSSAFITGLLNAVAGGRASVEGYLGVSLNASATSAQALLTKVDLASMASAEGLDVSTLKSNASGIKAVVEAAKTEANGNYSISNLTSVGNNIASSANSALFNASSAASSFANSTDENVTLASYYASSYSTKASNEAISASKLASSVDAGYLALANGDTKFAAAQNAYKAARSAEPNDAALAEANGDFVFNHAPKFVRALKNALIHNNTDYVKGSTVAKVNTGEEFTVKGVGFAQDGTTRYLVASVNKPNKVLGYLTANPAYTMNTYLPSQKNVAVTFSKTAKVYAKANSKKFTGKTVKAGTTLPNVAVVSLDGIYGGFTNIETPSGDFITANTAYVNINTGKSANNNATNNVKPANPVSFWN